DRFIEAATDGRADRADRLLARHPAIARANVWAALLLGDAATVDDHIVHHPGFVLERGGPRGWEPLHYVCYSGLGRRSAEREAGLVTIARRLISLGADPNLRYPWLHHGVHRPVLWSAVCVAGSLPLAAALLEAGANPSDGVTLPIAASGGNTAALDLLLAHGVDVDRPWATDGSAPVYAILQWAKIDRGVRWLLEHGADPDPVFADNGETPLHVVAARWDSALADAFVSRGADVARPRADGRTPYAIAELSGNRDVAAWLVAHGAPPTISEIDRLVAACARGERVTANLRSDLGPEHYNALFRAIELNDVPAVEAMLACGFDPNWPDESIGKTALHVAAQEGRPEMVRVLLAHGASVSARDREFKGQPLIWAAEGSRGSRADRDYATVGRLLLEAGSPTDWQESEEPSAAIVEIVNEWRGIE
ncbi:MAG TPA: ankyrin repeat domain-containing protein, partial [Vicinamibacterales bacterium]|nr:ankyrin repeat domain-containing protein [Vicinamibacterales bacterium]